MLGPRVFLIANAESFDTLQKQPEPVVWARVPQESLRALEQGVCPTLVRTAPRVYAASAS